VIIDCLNYLKQAALSIPNMPVQHVSLEATDTANFQATKRTPSVVIYHLNMRHRRDGQDATKTNTTALGGFRQKKYSVENTFLVTFMAKDRSNMEALINGFLDYLFTNKLVDSGDNEIVFTRDNFYTQAANVSVDGKSFYVYTTELSAIGGIYSDRQKVALNLELEFIVEGGNPLE
jgi:hypothetical protein